MKGALFGVATLALAPAISACPPALEEGRAWRVRSVRPRNADTEPLVGHPLRADELEVARRSFDAAPGGRFSLTVTVVYLERCEADEADLVFRSLRFRVPYRLALTPGLDLARAGAGTLAELHHEWSEARLSAGYTAAATSVGVRQSGWLAIRGDSAEARVGAGNGVLSARVLGVAPVVWQRPLLPEELRGNPEFETQVEGALASAEAILRLEQYARDPAFKRLAGLLDSLAPPDGPECLPAFFRRRLESARSANGARQYGLVDALIGMSVPPGCADPALDNMRREFARIDRQAAARRAAEQMRALRGLVNRAFYRTPLAAIQPVAMAEAVASGPRTALPGIGAGVRVSLLNWLEATAGMSWRIRHAPGAPGVTHFIEIRFRDPFR